jgi:hypothetical protein
MVRLGWGIGTGHEIAHLNICGKSINISPRQRFGRNALAKQRAPVSNDQRKWRGKLSLKLMP